MAHYAFLDDDNVVTEVIVGKDETDTTHDWEEYYGNIRGQTCKRTSFNTVGGEHKQGRTPFRFNYAGIGHVYDETHDGFRSPKPYDSWRLNESKLIWEAPTPYPIDNNIYTWNEEAQTWDMIR